MDFDYTDEQLELREKLRSELDAVMTPERQAAMENRLEGGPAVKECQRALGDANLLAVSWPEEYGGRGFSAIEQYLFSNEAKRVNAPIPMITLNTVGPTLMQFGSQQQKDFFLPKIRQGELDFAVGYSEPGAGSDLAALRTTAVRDGDEWVINGSKMWTSGAEFADYVWLAARTDPTLKKHKGLSLFIVPTSAPGFSWKPLRTMPGVQTYYTFYDDVRIPAENLVHEVNGGWALITAQLNLERAALGNLGAIEPLWEKTLDWARTTSHGGGKVIDEPWVQSTLARVEAEIAAYKLLNLRVNASIGSGGLGMAQASAAKVFGTELVQKVARELLEVVGANGIRAGANAPLRGALETAYRQAVITTFGGGANEVQRDIIAMAGLGMPRAPRDTSSKK
ncbi:acyl-CoA dehydrogenase family protein [uncultured Williamsia sp.]|uniref:acyl-CoA dehydrogenase family protein n=1 Tax=uncultured Williamsia sp. TaxID=259311 RepID=UPI00262EE175|nr:acyl-CoA dehydrogenase family protein [uncultured Williamsia sp.]